MLTIKSMDNFLYLLAAPLVFAGRLGAILISLRICVALVLSLCSSFIGPEALSEPWLDIFSTINLKIKTFSVGERLRRLQTRPEKLLDNMKGAVFCSHIKHSGCSQRWMPARKYSFVSYYARYCDRNYTNQKTKLYKILSGCMFDKGTMPQAQNPKKKNKPEWGSNATPDGGKLNTKCKHTLVFLLVRENTRRNPDK